MADTVTQSLPTYTPELQSALEIMTLLDPLDWSALAELSSSPEEWLRDQLAEAELLVEIEGQLALRPDIKTAMQASLEAEPDRLVTLSGRILQWYASQLATADDHERPAAEIAYMRQLELRCETLIRKDPAGLEPVAAAARLDLLQEPHHRALVRFYRGMGAGLRVHFARAQAAFDEMLMDPELDDTIRARVLNSGAVFARHQGDYERARDGFRQSEILWARLGNLPRQGFALMNQGMVSYTLQEYSAARDDLERSLAIFLDNEMTYWQAAAHSNLGLVARDQGRWEEALAAFNVAAAIFESEGSLNHLGHVTNNIGEVELLRGNFELAVTHFNRALEQITTRAYSIDVYVNLGLVHDAQADHEAAIRQYQYALELARETGRREIIALILYRIGNAHRQAGDTSSARAAYDAAIATIEETREPLRDEGLSISLMGRWQQVYEAAVHLSLAMSNHALAFEYAERARARAFADLAARHASELPWAHAQPATAIEVSAGLPDGTVLLSYFATGLQGPESDLLKAIPAQAKGLRACLAPEAHLILFAFSHQGMAAYDCALNPNALQALSPYRSDGQRFLDVRVLRRIHDALLAPVVTTVQQATRLIIAPYGPLHQLSFAALLDDQGRALLERMPALLYVPSATILLQLLSRSLPDQGWAARCLALGYDGTSVTLRHTEPEAEAIARICGGEMYRGAPGRRAFFLERAGHYRWLHLACHGEFDQAEPLRSWLELGPGEKLQALDVLEHPIYAELVTLSACRSGVSKVLRGDEPMGLVRAFLAAGVQTVLVTLWQVEDRSARLLMERFYTLLAEQSAAADPASALREAQLYLRGLTADEVNEHVRVWDASEPEHTDVAQGSHPYADPLYWAAYVVVGVAPASTSSMSSGIASAGT